VRRSRSEPSRLKANGATGLPAGQSNRRIIRARACRSPAGRDYLGARRRLAKKPGPAPIGKRIAARLLDCCLIGFIVAVSWLFAWILVSGECDDQEHCYGSGFLADFIAALSAATFIFGAIAPVVYDSFLLAASGQTIGKSALGLRVVRVDGSRPGWRESLLRALAFWIPLGIPSAISMARGQTPFHDWVAGTKAIGSGSADSYPSEVEVYPPSRTR
jgi:uncharacterized RDD family membrane protein YckC